jgi:hypothetical protein
MLRLLLKLALAGAFLFALWTWVPLGGRTLAQRWNASADPLDFVRRGVADAGLGDPRKPQPAGPHARPPRDHAPERVTEAERRALERRLADELARESANQKP